MTKSNMIKNIKSKKRPALFHNFTCCWIRRSLPCLITLHLTTTCSSLSELTVGKICSQLHMWTIILLEPSWWSLCTITCRYIWKQIRLPELAYIDLLISTVYKIYDVLIVFTVISNKDIAFTFFTIFTPITSAFFSTIMFLFPFSYLFNISTIFNYIFHCNYHKNFFHINTIIIPLCGILLQN